MFLGEFRHTLDEKSRITLPAKYRMELAVGVVMTTGFDRCLLVFSQQEFDRLADKMSTMQFIGREQTSLRRKFYSDASDALPDKQGRVIIPEHLRAFAGITNDVVIAGIGRYIELWCPDEWAKARAEMQEFAAQQDFWSKLGI
ncbi:MAG TPA: division/cell wall cluster transcriptional repressor MraZ [Anaerolineae bacterium]|jgi:MraZ protein